jgi:hypothetical protein
VSGNPDNLLLFPGVMLGQTQDKDGLPMEVHKETRVPFTGKKVDAFRCWRGLTHFIYTSFQNGKRNGLKIGFIGDGTITDRNYFKDNLFIGLSEKFYINGMRQERAFYEPTNKRKSKLLSIEVWKPSGKRCPYSYIDENGNGVRYSYYEDGKISDILFFEKFDYRAEIFPDDEGTKLESAWLFTGKTMYDHKEIKLL